ncbi:TetR/AcrR family transcriptional regulator [Herpetosiphon geysericola]|nr:TetR/AcrR family transcriptional regulator [Herpetosiphon geysericola]
MAKLIAVARAQFAEHGYAHAATEQIVQLAGVTRGALYHYFDSKEGLFRAVVAEIQRDLAQRIISATESISDPWQQLLVGCRAFLSASLDRDIQRIGLLDGPAILGWEAWRKLDAENSMRLLESSIQQLADSGIIAPASVVAATHLLSGAMNEAVLWIAQAAEPQQALDATIAVLEQLLSGLRQN